jgi:rare lipoprotein A
MAACTLPQVKQATQTPAVSRPAVDPAVQEAARLNQLPPVSVPRSEHPPIDPSGRNETGKASYYANHFDGRKMADGERFSPNTNAAASKTLPIGTTAKVVNLDTGNSATVTVKDRGPHVHGRVLDVSPKVASQLDLKHPGVASVEVKPIAVPQPDGTVKLGAGAAEVSPEQRQAAVKTTEGLTGDSSAGGN